MPLLSAVRLTDDQYQKLNEILEKLGIGAFKDGDDKSEKMRVFIDKLHSEIYEPKEVWLKSIQENNPPYETIPQNELQEQCPYHVIDEKGEWYCDIKKIPKAVCVTRQKRYLYMNRKCRPEHLKKSGTQRTPPLDPEHERVLAEARRLYGVPPT